MFTETSPDLCDQHIASEPIELDLTTGETADRLAHVMRCYAKLATRPRKRSAWAWAACELWNARQDALRSGALVKYRADGTYTDNYELVSSRYRDCERRCDLASQHAAHGNPDARV